MWIVLPLIVFNINENMRVAWEESLMRWDVSKTMKFIDNYKEHNTEIFQEVEAGDWLVQTRWGGLSVVDPGSGSNSHVSNVAIKLKSLML